MSSKGRKEKLDRNQETADAVAELGLLLDASESGWCMLNAHLMPKTWVFIRRLFHTLGVFIRALPDTFEFGAKNHFRFRSHVIAERAAVGTKVGGPASLAWLLEEVRRVRGVRKVRAEAQRSASLPMSGLSTSLPENLLELLPNKDPMAVVKAHPELFSIRGSQVSVTASAGAIASLRQAANWPKHACYRSSANSIAPSMSAPQPGTNLGGIMGLWNADVTLSPQGVIERAGPLHASTAAAAAAANASQNNTPAAPPATESRAPVADGVWPTFTPSPTPIVIASAHPGLPPLMATHLGRDGVDQVSQIMSQTYKSRSEGLFSAVETLVRHMGRLKSTLATDAMYKILSDAQKAVAHLHAPSMTEFLSSFDILFPTAGPDTHQLSTEMAYLFLLIVKKLRQAPSGSMDTAELLVSLPATAISILDSNFGGSLADLAMALPGILALTGPAQDLLELLAVSTPADLPLVVPSPSPPAATATVTADAVGTGPAFGVGVETEGTSSPLNMSSSMMPVPVVPGVVGSGFSDPSSTGIWGSEPIGDDGGWGDMTAAVDSLVDGGEEEEYGSGAAIVVFGDEAPDALEVLLQCEAVSLDVRSDESGAYAVTLATESVIYLWDSLESSVEVLHPVLGDPGTLVLVWSLNSVFETLGEAAPDLIQGVCELKLLARAVAQLGGAIAGDGHSPHLLLPPPAAQFASIEAIAGHYGMPIPVPASTMANDTAAAGVAPLLGLRSCLLDDIRSLTEATIAAKSALRLSQIFSKAEG